MRRSLTFVLLLLACESHDRADAGPPPFEPPTPQSGTRLRRQLLELENGERLFHGWYDTELETECVFRRSADGEYRCHPLPVTLGSEYRDAACTERVHGVVGCEAPAFIHVFDEQSCPPHSRTLRRTEEVSERPVYWTPGIPPMECRPRHELPGALDQFHAYTPVDERLLVTGEVVIERTEARVAARWIVTSDGAAELLGLYDTQREEPCSPVPGRDGGLCVPDSAVQAWPESPTCPDAVVALGPCEAGADLAFRYDGCPRTLEPRAIGPTLTASECRRDGELRSTEPAPAGAMGTLRRETAELSRLQVERYVTESGVVAPRVWPFFDPGFGSLCRPARVAGELRCVPLSDYLTLGSFADPGCTQPLAYRLDLPCGETLLVEDSTGCGDTTNRLYRPGAPASTEYWLTDDGRCERQPLAQPGLAYLEEVAPDELAPLTLVTE